ncbi:hypothetical protein [Novibacillus thermophilus]
MNLCLFTVELGKKKAKNLKMDLNELGVVVKDQGENQYVRKVL